jgi:hypothetical protein
VERDVSRAGRRANPDALDEELPAGCDVLDGELSERFAASYVRAPAGPGEQAGRLLE